MHEKESRRAAPRTDRRDRSARLAEKSSARAVAPAIATWRSKRAIRSRRWHPSLASRSSARSSWIKCSATSTRSDRRATSSPRCRASIRARPRTTSRAPVNTEYAVLRRPLADRSQPPSSQRAVNASSTLTARAHGCTRIYERLARASCRRLCITNVVPRSFVTEPTRPRRPSRLVLPVQLGILAVGRELCNNAAPSPHWGPPFDSVGAVLASSWHRDTPIASVHVRRTEIWCMGMAITARSGGASARPGGISLRRCRRSRSKEILEPSPRRPCLAQAHGDYFDVDARGPGFLKSHRSAHALTHPRCVPSPTCMRGGPLAQLLASLRRSRLGHDRFCALELLNNANPPAGILPVAITPALRIVMGKKVSSADAGHDDSAISRGVFDTYAKQTFATRSRATRHVSKRRHGNNLRRRNRDLSTTATRILPVLRKRRFGEQGLLFQNQGALNLRARRVSRIRISLASDCECLPYHLAIVIGDERGADLKSRARIGALSRRTTDERKRPRRAFRDL